MAIPLYPKLVSRNELLTPAAYAQLPPSCVDRAHWLPGYRARVIFSAADAASWLLLDVSQISVLERDVAMLFSRFFKPPNWLFPNPEPVPSDSDWDAELLDEEELRCAVKYFAIVYVERKQRRSRFGVAWKSFLKIVLLSIVAGDCDLDILLDPVVLHFPRPGERSKWYPGLHYTPRPANLFQALRYADRQDPWRNQYRHAIEDHPSSQLPRLEGKFIPLE
ncbi:hypothetical protein PHMEG_00028193 [Phytophthora megakarya]|uniref:Uncharacterized protein n=1 Tax=Phytophthora megakarya TaxID=4795 RepID=A0A225V543_9STRA|nr:hypothetical protein PHMEG_00028193 [Phytophthora megakarya]